MAATEDPFVVQVMGSIYWRLSDDCPEAVSLPFLPGWELIPPLHHQTSLGSGPLIVSRNDARIFIESREIVLRWQGGEPKHDARDVLPVAERLLRILRYLSRQQGIPRMSVAVFQEERSKPNYSNLPAGEAHVRDYMVQGALTDEHLRSLGDLVADFEVPIPADVMIDALDAQLDSDWRKTILYSAIAMESLASTVLDGAYRAALSAKGPSHRVVTTIASGGSIVTKDPVYEMLSSGDSFGRLLHERPLYLLGRSLMSDDQDLYRRALTVYKTRNKIAHKGLQPEDEAHLHLSREGALEALKVSIAVFAWFGDKGPFVPFETMIPLWS